MPTSNGTYGTSISWSSNDVTLISNDGVYGKPYSDAVVRLTATISYNEAEVTTYYDIIAKRYYKDLTDGVSMGYMYFSNSTASDNTYENIDIVVFAHVKANATGALYNLSTINSYLPSRVTKCHNNGTYALLSLGMLDNDHLGYMSTIAASAELRATLINNLVDAINTYHLDGIDIDWEFPSSSEKENFTLFMHELRDAVKANNPHHLVCAATGIDSYTRYDFANSAQYIDYISIMTYDMQYVTKEATYSSHHSALSYKQYHCYKAISNAYTYYVTNSGIAPSKLILGIPFYGRKFTDTDGLGQSATSSGAISYSAIVSDYLNNPNYEQLWDNVCQVPYLYSSTDKTFITYDSPESIALKCEYAANKGFAGVMYWQDAQDNGDDLFNAVINGMNNNKVTFTNNVSGLLGLLKLANKDEVIKVKHYHYVDTIYNDLVGTVSLYTPKSISVNTTKMIDDGEKSYGTFTDLKFVCIHDVGATGNALANAQYMLNDACESSWHYTVGDSDIYQDMSESYTAFHAGCGARVYSLEDTGVNANKYGNKKPVITINASGYYCINGETTELRPYSNIAGTTKDSTNYTTSQITDTGIYYEIGNNGNYYLNKTYYNSTYGKISNYGGNKNSIGIEPAVNNGSNIYQTWHNTAKLVADILVRNNLNPHNVLFHNSFSGKDCPHAMLNGDMTSEFLKMVEIEYMIRKYYSDYTITFESLSPSIINDFGQVIGEVTSDTTVFYRVTITKNDISQSIVLESKVLG